jgi:hypothetical protein
MIVLIALSALASDPVHYRLDMVVSSEAKVPVLGWQKSTIRSVSWVTLDADGAWSHQVCTVAVRDNTPLARTHIPDAFVASLPVTVAAAEVQSDTLRVDLGVATIGWDPSVVSTMPQAAQSPGVVDHEDDGRPGATVMLHIRGVGEFGIEVAQTSRAILTGTRIPTGWAGTVQTRQLEQSVFGADHRMLRKTPELRPRDRDSHFELSATTATSCEALKPVGDGREAS